VGLPTGIVTFLFTDIEGSTALWEEHPDQMRLALARHDAIMRAAIEDNHGCVFKTVGDAFCAAFAAAPNAVAAALTAQSALIAEQWIAPIVIKVRMALHTGSVEQRDNDYFGPALNRVARLTSVGHGGQVLVSAATQILVADHLPASSGLKDLGVHRLKDLGRAEAVYQLLHPVLPADLPALKSLGSRDLPNNLPSQLTSFIGREKEVAEVRRLLGSARLVTVTAVGGTGKTRLAVQAAAEIVDEYADGVWFIELATITEPDLVAQTIARLLNVNEASGEPILQALVSSLKSKQLVLVLDNCEHLVAECARVANALLRACSGVRILASSRQALNVTGEVVYSLPALSLPDPKARQTPTAVAQYDAVRLFVDRAAAVRSDFAVTEQNAATIAQLCYRLDGIPLALELAAARVRVLSVEEINSRLSNRFKLLTGGNRNVLPRQQTLRALIDWSYDLLDEQEQLLLARVSIFAAGWTLTAAERVCAGEGIDELDLLDLLTNLADKSLVVSDAETGEVRFRLLETLREYGREKLEALGEEETVADRHAEYYAAAAATIVQGKAAAAGAEYGWFSVEADNLRAALDRLWQARQFETASALAVNLREFWMRQGWLREAYAHLGRAVQWADALTDEVLRARVLKDAGWFAFLLGDLRTAKTLTASSVEASARAGATHIQADALNGLALVAQSLGDAVRARDLFADAIALVRADGRDAVLADYLVNLGFLESTQGQHDAAQACFSEARSIYEAHSNERGMAAWLCNQSDLALRRSNWRDAQSFAEQSLERFRKIDNRLGIAYALANLAEAAARQDDHALTDASGREAVAICGDTNHQDLLPVLLMTRAKSQLAQGQAASAAALMAGAARLRAMLNAPGRPDEQLDAEAMESGLRALAGDDILASAKNQLASLGADDLIKRLAPLL
jgi:predicted ATPase/class 3 adenylate cyclase